MRHRALVGGNMDALARLIGVNVLLLLVSGMLLLLLAALVSAYVYLRVNPGKPAGPIFAISWIPLTLWMEFFIITYLSSDLALSVFSIVVTALLPLAGYMVGRASDRQNVENMQAAAFLAERKAILDAGASKRDSVVVQSQEPIQLHSRVHMGLLFLALVATIFMGVLGLDWRQNETGLAWLDYGVYALIIGTPLLVWLLVALEAALGSWTVYFGRAGVTQQHRWLGRKISELTIPADSIRSVNAAKTTFPSGNAVLVDAGASQPIVLLGFSGLSRRVADGLAAQIRTTLGIEDGASTEQALQPDAPELAHNAQE